LAWIEYHTLHSYFFDHLACLIFRTNFLSKMENVTLSFIIDHYTTKRNRQFLINKEYFTMDGADALCLTKTVQTIGSGVRERPGERRTDQNKKVAHKATSKRNVGQTESSPVRYSFRINTDRSTIRRNACYGIFGWSAKSPISRGFRVVPRHLVW
jgi:hypothetical protein